MTPSRTTRIALLLTCAPLLIEGIVRAGTPAAQRRLSGADACRQKHLHEASTRQSLSSIKIDATSYDIDATIDQGTKTITAVCAVGVKSTQAAVATFSLDLVGLTVTSVKEGMVPVAFTQQAGQLEITTSSPLALGEERSYAIAYGGKPTNGLHFSGANNGIAFSFTEPSDARNWFPCRDIPEDKADWYRGRYTVPTVYQVASNGYLTSVIDNGNGTHTFTYEHSYPIATYLISVAVSDYQTFTQTASGGTPLKHFVFPSQYNEAVYDFANVPAMIDFYSSTYWPFPFPSYGMAVAPMGGAMEHQTMTTLDPRFITGTRSGEGVMAHELSHQWWGDMITCYDWKNIWLNEGFATYFDALFTQSFYGDGLFTAQVADNRFSYFAYEPFEGRFPVYAPSYLWGVTVYEKGSWVLHMLRHELGASTFIAIQQEWARQHRYDVVTTAQYVTNAENVSGVSLTTFFDQWVYKAGYPELRMTWSTTPGFAHVRVDQIQQVTTLTPLFDVPLDIRLVTPSGNVDRTVRVDRASQTFTIPVPAAPSRVILDPDVVLLHEPSGLDGLVLAPGPDPSNAAQVGTFNAGGRPLGPTILPYSVSSYGASVGAGNLDAESRDEVLTGPGPGAVYGPHARAFKVDGSALPKVSFFAYGTLKFGVNVAGGDVDADGYDEILTGAGPGAVFGPHVRGFDVDGGAVRAISGISFYAYSTLRYGANVISGSIDPDAYAEILTGAGPGAIFGPHVRGFDFDGQGPTKAIAKVSFFSQATTSYGVNVAVGDLDVDGMTEILAGVGPGPSYSPDVRGFDYDGIAVTPLTKIDLIPFPTLYGAQVGSMDEDGDAADGILVAPGADPSAPVYVYSARVDLSGTPSDFFAFPSFPGVRGAHVAGGRFQSLGITPLARTWPTPDPGREATAIVRGIPAP